MAKKPIKDVEGVIKKITAISDKEYINKTKGTTFKVYNVGLMMDDGSWHNIKGSSQEAVMKILYCADRKRDFGAGDSVKLYLEQEDAAGKYWKITYITLIGAVNEENIGEEESAEEELIGEEEEDDGVEEANAKYHVTPVGATSQPGSITEIKRVEKVEPTPIQQGKPVLDAYKMAEADKYELGMARNNAAIIFAELISSPGLTIEARKEVIKENIDYYDKLVVTLFKRGKELRKVILGY